MAKAWSVGARVRNEDQDLNAIVVFSEAGSITLRTDPPGRVLSGRQETLEQIGWQLQFQSPNR